MFTKLSDGAQRGSHLTSLGLVVVIALASVSGVVFHKLFLAPKDLPLWDPAHHMMWGMTAYSHLASGRFISFLVDSYRQVYWPFFHSWVIAGFMFLFGPTIEAARLPSLWAWGISMVSLAALAARVAVAKPLVAVAVTVGLWLTAAQFIRGFATEGLRESLAIGVTLAAFWALARAFESGRVLDHSLAGAAAVFTYITKTEYGVLLLTATAIAAIPHLKLRSRDAISRRQVAAYLLPIMGFAVVWFAYPAKISATIRAMFNQPLGPDPFSIEGFLYHFHFFRQWSDTTVSFVIFLASPLILLKTDKNRLLNVIMIYLLVAFVLHSLSHTKDPKHSVKFLPLLCLSTGVAAARIWQWMGRIRMSKAARSAAAIAFAVLVAHRSSSFVESARTAKPSTKPLLQAVLDRIPRGEPVLVLGEFAELSPYVVNFHLLAQRPESAVRPHPATLKTASMDPHTVWIDQKVAALTARYRAFSWIETSTADAIEVGHSRTKAWENDVPLAPAEVFKDLKDSLRPKRILVMDIEGDSPFQTKDYQRTAYTANEFLPLIAADAAFRRQEMLAFADVGVRLVVFTESMATHPKLDSSP